MMMMIPFAQRPSHLDHHGPRTPLLYSNFVFMVVTMTEYLKNAGKDDDLDGHSENGDHGRDDQARTQP